jgi:hypothetical protein
MAITTEQLIRASDNQIKLTLTEDGTAISGNWDAIDIHIGDVTITRTGNANGITFANGLLTINPGDLTTAEQTALDGLQAGRRYRTQIVVTSATNDDGAVFGGDDSDRLYVYLSDKPA